MSSSYRPLMRALYPIGPLLAFASVVDPVIRLFPVHPSIVMWRFGAVGVLSNGVVGFLFGFAWTIGIAAILDDRRTARTLSALLALVGVAFLGVLALFALDALQVRASVQPNFKPTFDMSVIKAMLQFGLSAPVALIIGIAGWRSTRGRAAASARPAPAVMLNRSAKEVTPAQRQMANERLHLEGRTEE